jgi:hypothetical protein
MAGGGNAIATRGIGSASFTNSAGGYVSGITAQIIRSENIIASVTVSQSRTNSGIPDPPERIADDLANRIVCVFTRGWCDYY